MLYALHENEDNASMITVDDKEARAFNAKGFGIFRTVNSFKESRKIVNLDKINSWYVEMDGEKPEQLLKIKDSPIYPSRVVESKNGYHLYFSAIDATLEHYTRIEEGLIHHFGGDPKAKDVTRVLREPGFHHWKDIHFPFMVKEIFRADNIRYREKDMFHFFSPPIKAEVIPEAKVYTPIVSSGEGLTEFLNGLDNQDALERLSRTSWVNFEEYSFKPTSRGRKNIIVNGKSTSCFIDENKRIGANPGGPNCYHWLRYFGHTDKEIVVILKEIYPGVSI
jgi:hypothetical protein